MTSITDMALPDAVLEKVALALIRNKAESDDDAQQLWDDVEVYRHNALLDAKTAIRAALQAMLDNGMAVETDAMQWKFDGADCDQFRRIPVLAIRLDADEREREEAK